MTEPATSRQDESDAVAAVEEDRPTAADRSRWTSRWATLELVGDPLRRTAGVAAVLAAVALSLVLTSVANAPRLSLLDESTHLDYAWRAGHLELTYTGQPFTRYTLEQWSCRGQANVPLPPCGAEAPHHTYPNRGIQYNAFHPPTYYVVTGVAARALAAATGYDFMTSARAFGAVWLFAGMLALYLTLRYWEVPCRFALLGAVLPALVPTVLHASSIVTNDAPALLCGVAALFVLGRVVVRERTGWVVPVVLSVLVASTKVLNALAMLVVAGVFAAMAVARWRRTGDLRRGLPLLRNAVLICVAVGAVYVGWDLVQAGRTAPRYENPVAGTSTDPIDGLPFDEWIPTLVGGASLGANYYLDPLVNGRYLSAWAVVATTVIAAASFVALAVFERGSKGWVVGATLLAGSVAYPLVVQLQALRRSVYFPHVSPRYGLTLIPIAAAALAAVAARKRLNRTGVAFVVSGFVVVLLTTVRIASST